MSKAERIAALEREVAELRGLVHEIMGYGVDEWYGRVTRLEGLTGHPYRPYNPETDRPKPLTIPEDDHGLAAQEEFFVRPHSEETKAAMRAAGLEPLGGVLIGGDRDR